MAVQKKTTPSAAGLFPVSLVIPCYNEAHRVQALLEGLEQFARQWRGDFEIIIANDGSKDETVSVIEASALYKELSVQNKFRVVSLPKNGGKGFALQAGVAAATKENVLTCDADLSTHPLEASSFATALKANRIVIASREHKQSQITEKQSRKLTGRIFNFFVRFLTPLTQHDTQCGFKLYPNAVAKKLFGALQNGGWSHDVEILYRAKLAGYDIKEMPVKWETRDGSKINVFSDAFKMLFGVMGVSLRLKWEFFFGAPLQKLVKKDRTNPLSESSDSTSRMLFALTSIVLFFLMTTLSFDYGITGDDLDQKVYGEAVLDFYTTLGKDTSALHLKIGNKENLHLYGGLFNMISAAGNRYIGGIDEYDMRHLVNSIAGFLAILFAGLLARRIGNWTTGFIALVLLGTWPQFFGQSMNNPKDIPFALGYVMTIYYLVKLVQQLPRPATMTWIMTTFAIAFTINIRVGGLILVGMLFAFVVGTFILDMSRRKAIGENAGYLAARLALVTVIGFFGGLLFWPFGLLAPLSNPFKALEEMSNFSMPIGLLFDGQMMTSKDIDWNYIPRWLWITTPLVILFAALAYAVVWFFARRKFSPTLSLLLIFATVFPWAYIVYQNSPLYDSLRQLLFILPLIAVLAALTWHYIVVSAKQRAVQYALVGLMVVGIILPVRFSIANHPNQYVYFNELIGGIKGAYGKYDTDYYMNSIRETAEWFRQSEKYKNATPQNKILLATNAVDPVNWYFRNDTAKVKIVYTKWNAPGNPKTRGARDWDYGIYFSRDVDPSMLRSGTWPSQKAIYINDADGVPLSVVIERTDKSDLLGYNAFQRKDFAAAEQHLTKAMQYNPQNEEAALLLTQVKLQLNKPREAVHYATQYLQLYPGSPMAGQINALIASVGSNQPNMR